MLSTSTSVNVFSTSSAATSSPFFVQFFSVLVPNLIGIGMNLLYLFSAFDFESSKTPVNLRQYAK
jgi:hypothetical protein